MESFPEQRLTPLPADPKPGCGRPGCACGLPVSERFVLWALRQWQEGRALPSDGSILHRGFKMAGLLEVLPDFAIAMDAFLFGARRAIEIHRPTCSNVSRDEATLVALCGLAQGDFDGPLMASLDVMRKAWRGEALDFDKGQGQLTPWPGTEGGPAVLLGAWRNKRWIVFSAEQCAGWIASGLYSQPEELEKGMTIYRDAGGKRAVLAKEFAADIEALYS